MRLFELAELRQPYTRSSVVDLLDHLPVRCTLP
jgi:hypothetical protein